MHCLLSLSVTQVHLKNTVKIPALSEKVSMDFSWPFLFSSLAKAQIPKKILPFSQLKVFLCCLHSVNLNRRGLECESACVSGENPYLLNVVSSNVTVVSDDNSLYRCF